MFSVGHSHYVRSCSEDKGCVQSDIGNTDGEFNDVRSWESFKRNGAKGRSGERERGRD